jgi:hypothetical protein
MPVLGGSCVVAKLVFDFLNFKDYEVLVVKKRAGCEAGPVASQSCKTH